MAGLLSKERIIAPADFNRWLVPLASIAVHLCIGSVYAWSIYNPSLTRVFGVVTSAADDWSLSEVTWVFSVAIVFLGLAAAFGGKWLEQVGPRKVVVVAACCWGGGYIVGAAGIMTHQLWLLYLGYGVIGGCGLGLAYVSPVSTLIRWFPDRRGMAAGMAIMGFGGGAMIGTPMKEYFIRLFYRAPDFLGAVADVDLVTQAGRRFAEIAGGLQEVVVIGAAEVRNMTIPGPEGVYLVDSGATGVAEAFLVIGIIYLLVMMVAAFSFRLPAPDWKPTGWSEPDDDARPALISGKHVDIDQALKTPQFYQLWIVLCLNVTAGIGVIGVARTMMTDIFGSTLPGIVDTSFARRSKLQRSGCPGPVVPFSEHCFSVTMITLGLGLHRVHAGSLRALVKINTVKSVRASAASMTVFTCSSAKPYPMHASRFSGVASCAKPPRNADHNAE